MGKEIYYSDKYEDETHEYRHVILPKVPILTHFLSILFQMFAGYGKTGAQAQADD